MLYRDFRPKTLEEVVDQDVAVTIFKNAAKNDKISHAYLLSGGRGTGKTTLARAFAKALNIDDADIYEVDAASNNGVEEMKLLSETFFTLPYLSKYKMYILDEVHMFSNAAFNAFLKNLEEPPKHVIFVMATTEVNKLPVTIISRCVHLELKSPSINSLYKVLDNVEKNKKLKIEKQAKNILALSGEGSYRDMLTNLDKVLSFNEGDDIKSEMAEKVLNFPSIETVFEFIKVLDGVGDSSKVFADLNEKVNNKVTATKFLNRLIDFSETLLMLRLKAVSMEKVIEEYGEDVGVYFKELLGNKTPKLNSTKLKELIDARMYIKNGGEEVLSLLLM